MSCSRASFLSSRLFARAQMVLRTTALQAQFFATATAKSLPLETMSGSFGWSFTRFSGLTDFSSVSTAPRLLRFPQGGLAAILRFRAKSEGLYIVGF